MRTVAPIGRVIGTRLFSNGTTRPVYRDHEGRYVLEDAGGIVRGHWMLTEDDGPDFADPCDALTVTRSQD